jgi:hypothetical protein
MKEELGGGSDKIGETAVILEAQQRNEVWASRSLSSVATGLMASARIFSRWAE